MAIRAFIGQEFDQLKRTLATLEKALQSGSINELRASGISTTTSPLLPKDVQRLYSQCRYELYLRVLAMDQTDAQVQAYSLIYTNPYTEKVMKVHSRSAVGVFGYPLPAPLIAPTP